MRTTNHTGKEMYKRQIEAKNVGDEVISDADLYLFERAVFEETEQSDSGKGAKCISSDAKFQNKNCYNPPNKNCCMNNTNYLTGEDYIIILS